MSINIKMEKDRLLLKLNEGKSFSEQKSDVEKYLNSMSSFLKKADIKVAYDGSELSFYEEMQLCELLDRAFDRKVDFCYKKHPPKELMRHILSDGEKLSLSVKRTVRGGEKIHSNGDLTVFGDVNPTAELNAAGDVYVLGNLRGRVHAGTDGDKKAIVFAVKMDPEQIKIADVTAFNPKTKSLSGCAAAILKDNEILIMNL